MRCSECGRFKTRECQANPGGADWDMAENFSCFISRVEQPPPSPQANQASIYASPQANQTSIYASPPPGSRPYYVTREETSSAWWLLPIFFGWMGGLASFFAVRDKDHSKAKNLLIVGVLISGIPFVFWLFAFSCGMLASF